MATLESRTARWRVVGDFLARAPALPVASLRLAALQHHGSDAGRDLPGAEALVDNALAVAGRTALAEASRARRHYLARLAFRPTPAGLFAGVATGAIGSRTDIATDGPLGARLGVGWGRLAALVRALLDEPELRGEVRLRAAPSLLRDAGQALWLARAARGPEARLVRAAIDPALDAVLAATQHWARWPAVRRAAAKATGGADADSIDELLLLLVDDGLLLDDLTPPLVGAPPLAALRRRLASRPSVRLRAIASELDGLAALLDEPLDATAPGLAARVEEARSALRALPGSSPSDDEGGGAAPLQAVLTLAPSAMTLGRTAVERAVAVAPIAFRLCSAFMPTWERATGPRLDAAVRVLVEHWEPGAFPLEPLALGRYGVVPGESPPATLGAEFPAAAPASDAPPTRAIPAPLLRLLVERMTAAARAGDDEIALSAAELDAVLPEADLPPTFELVLAPARELQGAPPGDGWLLGLHGPAGATWGRFAHALGERLAPAWAELRALEEDALGGARALDLDYAPSAAVADVACHPPLRGATLALGSWPEGPTVTPADLALVLGAPLGAASATDRPSAIGLCERERPERAVVPLQASRLRSTTIPEEGVHRLLVGFSLQRAVAPWALHPGPLAAMQHLPRISVDGFVVAPASWRIPEALVVACRAGGEAARSALASWRSAERVPPLVQVGFEDQQLPVDLEALDGAEAIETLAHLPDPPPRAWEIWPPLDRLADTDGRRVEAVVAVAAAPGTVAPPPVAALVDPEPDPAWRTFLLHGPPDRADRLLVEHVGPALAEARARGQIDAWFFLRYVDDAGRDHLRVRARSAGGSPSVPAGRRGLDRFAARLASRLAAARAAGLLAAVETAEYRPERVRWGGRESTPLVEEIFESDSELCLGLLALPEALRPDGPTLLVRSFDALGAGLGLDLDGRRATAAALRQAHASRLRPDPRAPDPLAPLYREHQASLLAVLANDRARRRRPVDEDPATSLLRAHAERLHRIRTRLDRTLGRVRARRLLPSLFPSLLHLAAVRLVGTSAEREAIAAYLWQRALEGLARRG